MLQASMITFGPYIHPTLQPDKFINLDDVPTVSVLSGRYSRKRKCGLLSMNVGGKRMLVIPSKLAYGKRNVGNGLIPPDSDLVFYVELVTITSS